MGRAASRRRALLHSGPGNSAVARTHTTKTERGDSTRHPTPDSNEREERRLSPTTEEERSARRSRIKEHPPQLTTSRSPRCSASSRASWALPPSRPWLASCVASLPPAGVPRVVDYRRRGSKRVGPRQTLQQRRRGEGEGERAPSWSVPPPPAASPPSSPSRPPTLMVQVPFPRVAVADSSTRSCPARYPRCRLALRRWEPRWGARWWTRTSRGAGRTSPSCRARQSGLLCRRAGPSTWLGVGGGGGSGREREAWAVLDPTLKTSRPQGA